jgi:hypothetical protein
MALQDCFCDARSKKRQPQILAHDLRVNADALIFDRLEGAA